MAQMLERIESKLAMEHDDFLRAELLAKKAAYLGRVGQSDEAKRIIQLIRQTFNDGRSGRVTCLVLVAEGVLLYHAFQNLLALDKFSRALLLAEGLRETDVIGICAAWKAFIDFDQSRFASMKRSLLLARDLGLEQDHAVQSRMAVTLMTGAILLGKRDYAKHWFHFGHRHAVADGDLACIDGLLFNRAVFGLARQRIEWCRDSTDREWCEAIRAELESARNLQHLVGITTMKDHIDLCVARLDLIEGRTREALEGLNRLQVLERFSGRHVNATALAVDRIFALSFEAQSDNLGAELESLELSELDELDPDERVVAFTMLSRLTETLSGYTARNVVEAALQHAEAEYQSYEVELHLSLSEWLQPGT
jgi:hypothetical protein